MEKIIQNMQVETRIRMTVARLIANIAVLLIRLIAFKIDFSFIQH